jgi:hypothetical protein
VGSHWGIVLLICVTRLLAWKFDVVLDVVCCTTACGCGVATVWLGLLLFNINPIDIGPVAHIIVGPVAHIIVGSGMSIG